MHFDDSVAMRTHVYDACVLIPGWRIRPGRGGQHFHQELPSPAAQCAPYPCSGYQPAQPHGKPPHIPQVCTVLSLDLACTVKSAYKESTF